MFSKYGMEGIMSTARFKRDKMRDIYTLVYNYALSINSKNDIWIECFYSDTFPKENSWRFKCSGYLCSGSNVEYQLENYCNLALPWYAFPNNILKSEDFCWIENQHNMNNKERYWTDVMAITGFDTAYDLRYKKLLNNCDELIVLIEVNNSGCHWAKKGDISIDEFKRYFKSRVHNGSIAIFFLDGTIWVVDDKIPIETLLKFFTSTEVKKYKRDIEIGPYILEKYNAPK